MWKLIHPQLSWFEGYGLGLGGTNAGDWDVFVGQDACGHVGLCERADSGGGGCPAECGLVAGCGEISIALLECFALLEILGDIRCHGMSGDVADRGFECHE